MSDIEISEWALLMVLNDAEANGFPASTAMLGRRADEAQAFEAACRNGLLILEDGRFKISEAGRVARSDLEGRLR